MPIWAWVLTGLAIGFLFLLLILSSIEHNKLMRDLEEMRDEWKKYKKEEL